MFEISQLLHEWSCNLASAQWCCIGAGDAFSAVLLLGLHLGWSLSTTMASAQAFASASVTQQGATVQTLDFYQAFINEWHLSETYL